MTEKREQSFQFPPTPLASHRASDYTRNMDKIPCVYILASKPNGTLYIGVTSDLPKRIHEHKNSAVPGFTKEYNVKTLVWFEVHEIMESAIQREKAIKKWNRRWKIRLIQEENPTWDDLLPTLF